MTDNVRDKAKVLVEVVESLDMCIPDAVKRLAIATKELKEALYPPITNMAHNPKTDKVILDTTLNHNRLERINLKSSIEDVINLHCRENTSNTPYFILAEYLLSCLEAFEAASKARERWYGKELKIQEKKMSKDVILQDENDFLVVRDGETQRLA